MGVEGMQVFDDPIVLDPWAFMIGGHLLNFRPRNTIDDHLLGKLTVTAT